MLWHVAFVPANRPTHCIAFAYDGRAGVWLVVSPGAFADKVFALKPRRFDRWIRLVSRHADILRLVGHRPQPTLGLGFWCVGRMKRLIGFRSGALSPGGLRRDLLRHGAVRAFTPRP